MSCSSTADRCPTANAAASATATCAVTRAGPPGVSPAAVPGTLNPELEPSQASVSSCDDARQAPARVDRSCGMTRTCGHLPLVGPGETPVRQLSSRLRILPVEVIGRASTNSTMRGYL